MNGVDQAYEFKTSLGGVVVEKNINPGAELRSDQMLANVPQLAAPMFVITDPARLWVQIAVPERDQGRVRPGQAFVVRSLSLPDESFAGHVEVVSDSLDPTTRTIKVRGTLPNSERRLKAEMFVKVEFTLEPEHGTEVPARAVFLHGDKRCVLVEDGPWRYSRHEVSVSSEQSGRIILTQGLMPGQRVVVDSALLLEQVLEEAPASE
jgi:cobalt-zinc-cadmium efflux system membrane fusion protein